MKRDARIGLAVVLVLGLAVTLLIGRALYKDNDHLAATEGENAAGDAAVPYSGDVRRVAGAETTGISAAAAASPVNQLPGAGETAVKPADTASPAVDKFIADQTSHALPVAKPTTGPAPVEPTGTIQSKDKTVATPKPGAEDPLADHERPMPPKAGAESGTSSSDGYAYTVAANDNIWKISNKVYGDGKYTQKIMEANPGLHADKMKVGSIIRIPNIAHKTVLMKLPSFADAGKAAAKPAGEAVAAGGTKKAGAKDTAKDAPKDTPDVAAKQVKVDGAPVEAQTYKVESGDTLSGIAKKFYGASTQKAIARIVAANKGLDPAKIRAGQELTIPAK